MVPAAFDEENVVLDPNPLHDKDRVESLSCFVGKNDAGDVVTISCWKPTKEEMEEIKKTGRVWVHIMCYPPPAIAIDGFNPFKPRE